MIAIVCVDDNNGTMFNRRRQSQDRVLRKEMLAMAKGKRLWMNSYSAAVFSPDELGSISVADDFLSRAGEGDFCFVEGDSLAPYESVLEAIILYKWNRVYPADTYFDIPLSEHGWKLTESCNFVGSSHEKITKEVYKK